MKRLQWKKQKRRDAPPTSGHSSEMWRQIHTTLNDLKPPSTVSMSLRVLEVFQLCSSYKKRWIQNLRSCTWFRPCEDCNYRYAMDRDSNWVTEIQQAEPRSKRVKQLQAEQVRSRVKRLQRKQLLSIVKQLPSGCNGKSNCGTKLAEPPLITLRHEIKLKFDNTERWNQIETTKHRQH